jgi:hypothetical protein
MTVLVGVAIALGALQGSDPEKPAPGAPSAFVEPQDPDRPSLPASDLKSLRESNIYSPRRPVRKPVSDSRSRPQGSSGDVQRAPKPPLVTGIVFDPVAKLYQVVVEDRNPERFRLLTEPKFLKAGDQILSYTIDAVEAEKVAVSAGGIRKEFKVGEALPDVGLKSPESAETPSDEDAEAAGSEGKSEPKADAKSDSKAEAKPDSKRSDASGNSTMDEETRKKILEERMKRLGKKRQQE